MDSPPTVDTRLTATQLDAVIRAITYMRDNFENPAVFDKETVQLSRADLQDILTKLSAAQG